MFIYEDYLLLVDILLLAAGSREMETGFCILHVIVHQSWALIWFWTKHTVDHYVSIQAAGVHNEESSEEPLIWPYPPTQSPLTSRPKVDLRLQCSNKCIVSVYFDSI